MEIVNWIRFLIGALMIVGGLYFYAVQLIGIFRFEYVLNRMHAAAIGDTLGTGLLLFGVVILNGLNIVSFKLFFVLGFLWFTAPVASHVIAKLLVLSQKSMEDCCPVEELDEYQEEHREEHQEEHQKDEQKEERV